MNANIQPFVWLYLRTGEDNYQTPVRFPLSNEFLRLFQDESAFNADGVVGSSLGNTGRVKSRLVVFDPSWTYLETLLLINKQVDYEFGWLDEQGTVISTSGRVRATVASIQPTFQYDGVELEVILLADMSGAADPGSVEFIRGLSISTHTYLPEPFYQSVVDGNYYNQNFPHKLFTDPNDRKLKELARKRKLAAEQAKGSISGSLSRAWGVNPAPSVDNEKALQVTDEEVFGEKYTLPRDASPYKSVSDIVVQLAKACGMKYDVDETAPAKETIQVVNKTVYEFIKTQLLPIARSKETGRSGYRFWIRGDTVYFKLVNTTKIVRNLVYGTSNNVGIDEQFGAENPVNATVLSFNLVVRPNMLVAGPRANTIAVSFDPINKTFRGVNLVPVEAKVQNVLSEEEEVNQALQPKVNFGNITPKKEEELLSAASVDDAITDAIQSQTLSAKADKYVGEYLSKTGAFVDEATLRGMKDRALTVLKRRSRSARKAATPPTAEANLDLAAAIRKDVADKNKALYDRLSKSMGEVDPTMAGRLYTLPYADSRTAEVGRFIFADAMSRPIFTATAKIMGDCSIRLLDVVHVTLESPYGPHYGSGRYVVHSVNSVIDAQGFTTELTLVTDGTTPTTELESSMTKSTGAFKESSSTPESRDTSRDDEFYTNIEDPREK